MVRSYIDFIGGMVVQWSNSKSLTLYWSPYGLRTVVLLTTRNSAAPTMLFSL